MKHLSILFLLVLFILSCSKIQFDGPKITEGGTLEQNYSVSIDLARLFVGFAQKGNELASEYPLVDEGDTLCYVFNYQDGWAIIAADRRVPPVMAYDEHGHLPDVRLDTPFFGITLEDVLTQIKMLKHGLTSEYDASNITIWNNVDRLLSRRKYTKTIEWEEEDEYEGEVWWEELLYVETETTCIDSVAPLITTKWGQCYPWNNGFPVDNGETCPTGCVAVAMAQLLNYLHGAIGKPSGLYHDAYISGYRNGSNYHLDISLSNYVDNSPRWLQMPVDMYDQNIVFARNLMIDVGYRFEIEYTADGSGADVSTSKIANYGISCTKGEYDYSTLLSNLQAGLPVLVTAYRTENKVLGITVGFSNGHCWILDGWRRERTRQRAYTRLHRIEITLDDYDWLREDSESYYLPEDIYTWYPDAYDGAIECSGDSYSDSVYWMMNWGYDGVYDNVKYGTYSGAPWKTSSDRNYKYKRRFYYGFN